MPSDNFVQLTKSPTTTVTHALAEQPNQKVSAVAKDVFEHYQYKADKHELTESEELDRVVECGSFPHRPRDLFLKVFRDVLVSIEHDPMAGMVSPSLIGTSATAPLSIVSVIPDIMRHYAELVKEAQFEAFIATNYWENSKSAAILCDGLRELSKRAEARGGPKVVIKLMYDRGTPSQVITNHALVEPEKWTKVGLPAPNEIPFIDLEVINYHRPLLGTFHAKYMVVDRKVACINSNNIQDRPNVEMTVHFEGPIVDSFYDMALISWANALNPPLPLLSQQPWDIQNYPFSFQRENKHLNYIYENKFDQFASGGGDNHRTNEVTNASASSIGPDVPSDDKDVHDVSSDAPSHVEDKANGELLSKVTKHLNAGFLDFEPDLKDYGQLSSFQPHIIHKPHEPFPAAMVNRVPRGTPGHEDPLKVPQNIAWLSAIRYAQKTIFIQSPTFNASPVVDAILEACRRDVKVTLYLDLGFNDQGEMLPFQGGANEAVVNKMFKVLNTEGKQDNLRVCWYTAKDQQTPVSASVKTRNCHVKFMAVDEELAILGNGNQDTQSWFHSQEINVMVDSSEVTKEWIDGINANQNTDKYGQVDRVDGVWRDSTTNKVISASGTKGSGLSGYIAGFKGAIARVKGTGGF